MAIARFKPARVNIDYHVELDGHYYSVPHALVGQTVDVRITACTLEVLHGHKRVASPCPRAPRGGHTTTPEHMPASHRAHLQWTPAKLIAWGERVGAATAAVVRWQMEHRQHPEQGYRSCLGLMRLGREWDQRAGWRRPVRGRSRFARPSYKSVASILQVRPGSAPLNPPMGATGKPAAARERARAGLLPLTTDSQSPHHPSTHRTARNNPCSTNKPWTNCASCAWTAWWHALQRPGQQSIAAGRIALRRPADAAGAARGGLA
jgi:hypothetical protein